MIGLRRGDIVLVEIVDPQLQNPKLRPVVVLTKSAKSEFVTELGVVGITGTIPKVIPDDFVKLPYHANRHPRTGLTKKSAAVCGWLVTINETGVQKRIGRVPEKQLREIVAIVNGLEE